LKPIAARLGPLLILSALVLACPAPAAGPRGTSAGGKEGLARVHLAPLEGEARRLTFEIVSLAALSEEGAVLPLELSLRQIDRESAGHERLLAQGALPAGSYAGLLVEVKTARLRGEEGVGDLPVPEEPWRVPVPFRVSRKGSVQLSLRLPFSAAVVSGHRFEPAFEAAVAPVSALGLTALVTCPDGALVSFYDKASGRSFASIPLGGGPSAVAIGRRTQRAYVALSRESAVAIIDLQERDVIDRIPLGAGDEPRALALGPDERTLITANTGSGTVSFLDVASRVEIDRVRVGENPEFVRIDPQGRRAYVLNSLSNTVSVLDLARRVVALTFSTDPGPLQGDFDRRGTRFYLIHRSSPYLLVVDTQQAAPPTRIYIGAGASAVTVDHRSDRILVARADRGEIEVYDSSSLLPVDALPVGTRVSYLTVDLEKNLLHVVLPRENRIRILRLSNRKLLTEVDVGDGPTWVALMGER
jgi:YVTN family beta-propeller protein